MSMDTVDDLHFAEDTASSAVAALDQLLAALAEHRPTILRDDLDPLAGAISNARAVVAGWPGFCRPTCRFLDEGECADGDCCGCPCDHDPAKLVDEDDDDDDD